MSGLGRLYVPSTQIVARGVPRGADIIGQAPRQAQVTKRASASALFARAVSRALV